MNKLNTYTIAYNVAYGKISGKDDLENCLRIPFYRNKLTRQLESKHVEDPELLFKSEDEKNKFINELKKQYETVKQNALKLLNVENFEVISNQGIDIYNELSKKTKCKGLQIIDELEKMGNSSPEIRVN